METLAHTSPLGDQSLKEHLENVGALAAEFAAQFGMSDCARLCGLVHDIGKSSVSFQRHLRGCVTPPNYHKDAGAKLLWNLGLPYLAMAVDGHHGGLNDYDTWSYVMRGRDGSVPQSKDVCQILGIDQGTFDGLVESARREWDAHMTRWVRLREEACEKGACRDRQVNYEAQFAVRMLFSCLVDADFIDTERACLGTTARQKAPAGKTNYLRCYDAYMAAKQSEPRNAIMIGRERLNKAACKAGDRVRGMRRLSADTGLGKTLASLGFALHSMERNGLRRTIVSIPFNTIADQTYAEFRRVLGDDNVLEATSSFDVNNNDDESQESVARKALLTENWDETFIITSNVQLLESLHSNKVSACRKLHNVANSVIVFDEVQTFDEALSKPTLEALELLVRDYGCDVLMMSATCPDFAGMRLTTFGMPIEDIVWDDGASHQAAFSRVSYVDLGRVTAHDIIDKIDATGQTLVILNTRRQAREFFNLVIDACKGRRLAMSEQNIVFLSNSLCPVSREGALAKALSYLDESGERHEQPCVIVSTTLVEAGVDLDAQYVFRCVSGADSILQAAGRANRHGNRDFGIVYLFDFDTSDDLSDDTWRQLHEKKRSSYDQMDEATDDGLDIDSPEFWDQVIEGYLEERYERHHGWLGGFAGLIDTEGATDDVYLQAWDFRRWSKTYQLIRDAGVTIFVPIDDAGKKLFDMLASHQRCAGCDKKAIRRYCVTVPEHVAERLVEIGHATDFDGIVCVNPTSVACVYDPRTGIDT